MNPLNWNHRRTSNHKPFPVIGIGVKFEETMVITVDDAYWLDDDLPHVKACSLATKV